MITVFATGPGRSITVEHIDAGKLARASARKNAPKPGATRKIQDKRRKPAKHKKPLRGEE